MFLSEAGSLLSSTANVPWGQERGYRAWACVGEAHDDARQHITLNRSVHFDNDMDAGTWRGMDVRSQAATNTHLSAAFANE